jgi:rsbT co-antagonist protein RsbR
MPLAAVERTRSTHVIFDITGVPIVDTHVAQVLLQTTAALRLLGARVLLVGIRPEVAQTIIALNIDMGMLSTYPDLQEAVFALLAQRNGRHPQLGARLA